MRHTKKIASLRAISVIVVMMLGAIQLYLVSNTYHLTKQTYVNEVTARIDTFQSSANILVFHERVLSGMLTLSAHYAARQIDKPLFLEKLKDVIKQEKVSADLSWTLFAKRYPQLEDIRYAESIDRIVIAKNGRSDSLLYRKAESLTLLGSLDGSNNGTWQVTQVPKQAIISQDNSDTDPAGNYRVDFTTARHIGYLSRQPVFMRMFFVFVLSFALFGAMIVILFLNFKAIYQQKKIADIRTDFASNITHELQTPISTISVIVKTLGTEAVQSDHRLLDDTVAALDRQQQRLRTIVDSVLESAMVETNDLRFEPVTMPDFLSSYLNDYPRADRTFDTILSQTPLILYTGKEALERILKNILENAVKYSPDGSAILITTALTAKSYMIAIRNEGAGIAKEHHQQIFEKFYRVPQQNLHAVKGLGLGLFLCSELISRLNGTIRVESDKDKGCTFVIHLPTL